VAQKKVRRFADEEYYGRPLSGFGDINAKLLIVGLAPAAHGGNRTGRMFTGDSSGDWVAKVMHRHGFASIPTSQSSNDGLTLKNAYITAVVRCAPPQNKPTKEEMSNCFDYLKQEYKILTNVSVILCLGKIAYDATCKLVEIKQEKFGHNKLFVYDSIKILTSYHPSKQNTQTGRLTWKDWSLVFQKAKRLTK
jgi:uracil-DNA glycosylase family 4